MLDAAGLITTENLQNVLQFLWSTLSNRWSIWTN